MIEGKSNFKRIKDTKGQRHSGTKCRSTAEQKIYPLTPAYSLRVVDRQAGLPSPLRAMAAGGEGDYGVLQCKSEENQKSFNLISVTVVCVSQWRKKS